MRTATRAALPLIAALMTIPPTVNAADNPASHQHGHASLQAAFDGSRVDTFLLSPAANLLGFEHPPKTDQQQQTVEAVTHWARSEPMINTPAGDCSVVSANVHITWPENTDHRHDHHNHRPEAAHADIEISQTLQCPALDRSAPLTTELPQRFAALSSLEVQWVAADGQGAVTLKHGQTRFTANTQ